MSAKYEDDPPEKKIIFIVHGLNIWGFTELPYLFEINNFVSLLKNYLEHLDKFDIYLIPMANPDGVSFSLHVSTFNCMYLYQLSNFSLSFSSHASHRTGQCTFQSTS